MGPQSRDPEKRKERLERYERVLELKERGLYVEDIAREVGLSQATVVSWLNAGGFPEQRRRKRKKPSPVEPYADYLERRFRERCINMAQLFGEIEEMGYEGSHDASFAATTSDASETRSLAASPRY